MDAKSKIKQWLRESAMVKEKTAKVCTNTILAAAEVMVNAFRNGGKLLLCGNGGSAADCQHMATELMMMSTFSKDIESQGLPAIALTTDTSFLTAHANDKDFEGVFERQIEILGRNEDILIAISTSGNSPNILRAVKTAQMMGIKTIGITGVSGKLREVAGIVISVPSNNTQRIQETHFTIEHIICELVEEKLFRDIAVSEI